LFSVVVAQSEQGSWTVMVRRDNDSCLYFGNSDSYVRYRRRERWIEIVKLRRSRTTAKAR